MMHNVHFMDDQNACNDQPPISNHTGVSLQALAAAAALAAVARLPLEPDLSVELASPKTESKDFDTPTPGNPHFQDTFLFYISQVCSLKLALVHLSILFKPCCQ